MKKAVTILLAICMSLTLFSCGKTEQGETEPTKTSSDVLKGKTIGCSICYKGDEWCVCLADTLESLAREYGATLVCEDGNSDDKTQTTQLEKMIENKCDAIFFDPVSPSGCTDALNKVTEAGIPLILFDEFWADENDGVITTVTWDQYRSGVDMGNYFLEYVRENGNTANIVELTSSVSPHFAERFKGFNDTVTAATDCKITIVDTFDTNGEKEKAEKHIEELTVSYDYIVVDIDPSAFGAVSALRKAENTDVKVFSLGGYGKEPFEAVNNDDPNYIAFVDIDPKELASKMFECLIQYFDGKAPAKIVNIDQYIIDKTNCKNYWDFD